MSKKEDVSDKLLGQLFNWRTTLHYVLEHETDADYQITPYGRGQVSEVCYQIEDWFENAGGRKRLLTPKAQPKDT